MTKDAFIRIVRDELRLPLANPDLETEFDQTVNWRSIHVVRLVVAFERHTGHRVPVGRLLAERTTQGIYSVIADAA